MKKDLPSINKPSPPAWVLILALIACTSSWFAGNAALRVVPPAWQLSSTDAGILTLLVQAGFVVGAGVLALSRASAKAGTKAVFLSASLVAAASCGLLLLLPPSPAVAFGLRFLNGLALAGIYPLGLALAIQTYGPQQAARLFAWLVGALVLGTAFPFVLTGLGAALPFEGILLTVIAATLMATGMVAYAFPNTKPNVAALLERQPQWKPQTWRSALGYWGHMWELYTFWAFLPQLILRWRNLPSSTAYLAAGLIIAVGAIACVAVLRLATRLGTHRTALVCLAISGTCAALSPFMLQAAPMLFFTWLAIWAAAVIPDSPLFTSDAARNEGSHAPATLLWINSIGFAITIIGLACFPYFLRGPGLAPWGILAIGPALGLLVQVLPARQRA